MRFVIPISTNKGQPITKIQSTKTNSLILSNEVNIKNEISIITRRETKMFILCVQIKQTFLVPFGDRSNAIVPQMGKNKYNLKKISISACLLEDRNRVCSIRPNCSRVQVLFGQGALHGATLSCGTV